MEQEINSFQVRKENPGDWDEVYNLIRVAFETAQVKDGDEQDFATGLRRNSERYIPDLSLVAEKEEKLIGHVMLTHTKLIQPNESVINVLLLAPLSVLLEYRNQGVGGHLIKEACKRATQAGYKAIFLCGNPVYYNRFGFTQTINYNITSIQPIPNEFVLVYELEEGFLDKVEGKIECC